jgi:hypothetical protein
METADTTTRTRTLMPGGGDDSGQRGTQSTCGIRLSRTRREPSIEDALSMRDEAGFRDDASIAESASAESVGEDGEPGRRSGARPRGFL